jgi:predicted ATP-dependent serine protease
MQERPELVIIDSFSMLHGVKVESVVENMLSKFREVAQVTGCHQIFIMQQNKLGDTKGSSSIGHLVDIEVFLDKKVVPTVRELDQKISMEHDGLPVTSRLRAIAKGFQNVLAPQFRGCFQVEVRKNRCGPSNNYVVFKHVDNGVEFVFSNLLKAE